MSLVVLLCRGCGLPTCRGPPDMQGMAWHSECFRAQPSPGVEV